MRDVFPDEAVDGKSAGEFTSNDADAGRIRDVLEAQQVCPFCGAVSDGSQPVCAKCAMENTAVARKATKLRIGPWYVLQNRNPAAPGMKWETLLAFVRKGRIKPNTVVRGPTTHQLWRFAAQVKGLSREFGVCYSCGGSMERGANLCTQCNRLQEPPLNPDTLLEGAESDPRLPIYKEIAPPAVVVAPAPERVVPPVDPEEMQKKIREQAEALLREQQEQNGQATARDREEIDREREASAQERQSIEREKEIVARAREAIEREKEALERDRLALARERELALREREKAPAPPPAESREKKPAAAAPNISVWDLPEVEAVPPPPAPAAKKSAPAAEKPSAAAASGGRHKAPSNGGFLSAKDLANAFKLNHAMAAAARERKTRPDDVVRGETPAGSSRFKPIVPGERRSSGAGKWLVLLLILVSAGIAIGVAIKPAWRERAITLWGQLAAHKPKANISPAATQPDQNEPPGGAATTEPAGVNVLPNGIPLQPQPPTEPPAPIAPIPTPAAILPATRQTPAAPPATAPIAAPPVEPPPAAPVVPAPPPAQATVAPPAPAPAAPVPEPPVSSESAGSAPVVQDAMTQAKTLYRSGIQAEVRGNFAEAVRLFEEIEKLPSDAWPSDVELRLKLDRVQMKQK